MAQRRLLVALALLLLASGCGDDEDSRARTGPEPGEPAATTDPGPSESIRPTATTADPDPTTATAPQPVPDHPIVDDQGVLYRIALPPGECETCDFLLELNVDGTASYTAPDERVVSHTVEVAYDVAAFVELLTLVEAQDLVAGRTDCGREVDGNAPVFALGPGPEIDTCYWELVTDHPVNVFVATVQNEARAAHEQAMAQQGSD